MAARLQWSLLLMTMVVVSGARPLQQSMLAVQQQVFKQLQSIGSDGSLLTFPWCYHDPAQVDDHEKMNLVSLKDHLSKSTVTNFTDEDYFEMLRIRNKSALNVYLDIGIYQIVEVNEKQRYLSLKLQTATCWEDCRVIWDYEQFPLTQLILSPTLFNELKLFVPYLTVLEDLSQITSWDNDYDAIVLRGFVCIRKTYSATVSCNIDVKMYPLDTQQCYISFIAMQDRTAVSLHPYEVLLNDSSLSHVASSMHTMSSRYTPSDTWELIILNGEKLLRSTCLQKYDPNCQQYYMIRHRLVLRRHPTYQLINLMLPACLIVIISSCVFILPPNSEDKVGLSLTVLLSMFIFMQIMYNKMPETGETLPLLSQYYLVCVGLVALSCIVNSVSIIFAASGIRAPGCLHRVVCMSVASYDGPLPPDSANDAHKAINGRKFNRRNRFRRPPNGPLPIQRLASAFDRFFFLTHVLTSILALVVYFIYGYIPWKNYNYLLNDTEWIYAKEQLELVDDEH